MVFPCQWCKSRHFYTEEALRIHVEETCTSPSLVPLQNYVAEAKRNFQYPGIGQITKLLIDAGFHWQHHSVAKAEGEPLSVAEVEVEQPVANAGRAARRRRRRAAAAAARRKDEKMKEIEKSCAENDQFIRLPYEMVLEIINKIIDLKTLCIFHLVSKRFSSMVIKANTVSLNDSESYFSACRFLEKFTKVKSLCIQLPKLTSFTYDCLFKWKIKFSNRFDSFVFLSPNSVYNTNRVNQSVLQNVVFRSKKYEISLKLLLLATDRLLFLGNLAKKFPLLEYVYLTDFGKEGTVSVKGGGKILQLKNIVSEETEIEEKLHLCNKPRRISWYYVPELSVSGYIMKGITMILIERDDLPNDSFMSFFDDDKDTGFNQDKEEAAYHEAMMEIFMNHRHPIRMVS